MKDLRPATERAPTAAFWAWIRPAAQTVSEPGELTRAKSWSYLSVPGWVSERNIDAV